MHANLSRKSDKIARNILENTLLADFIALLDADKRRTKNKRCAGIKIFPKVVVRPEVNSFSYMMLIAPFLSMIDGELPFKTSDGDAMKIDITKILSLLPRLTESLRALPLKANLQNAVKTVIGRINW